MSDRLQLLKDSLSILMSPSNEQLAHLKNLGDVGVDELALEYDDIACAAAHMVECGELTSRQRGEIESLSGLLKKMSLPENSALWTQEALSMAAEWREVRRLARETLESFCGDDRAKN
jgi:hypothetical protein